jgi:hypothetical protein
MMRQLCDGYSQLRGRGLDDERAEESGATKLTVLERRSEEK